MKRLVLGTALVVAALATAQDPDVEGIDWRLDLKKARAEAQKTGKPMLVVFR